MSCSMLKGPLVSGVIRHQLLRPSSSRSINIITTARRPGIIIQRGSITRPIISRRKNPSIIRASANNGRGITEDSAFSEEEGKGEHPLEAILVLAGGQVPGGGGVPLWVERRLDKALSLQKQNGGPECRIVCLGNGTPHRRPLLTSEGFVIHESTSCADYLIKQGAPVPALLKEWGSYDTIGNGFFALTQHAIPQRWRTMAVVTSDFHMPRTHAIFEWVFGLQGAGTSIIKQHQHESHNNNVYSNGSSFSSNSRSQGFMLQYHSVSDDGIDNSIIQARRVKEKKALESLMRLAPSISTLSEFHNWFHTQHKCYNVEHQSLFGKQALDDPALLSY